MTIKEAWLKCAGTWDDGKILHSRASSSENADGICGSLICRLVNYDISSQQCREMSSMMEKYKPADTGEFFWWPVTDVSSNKKRADFCRLMADMCG